MSRGSQRLQLLCPSDAAAGWVDPQNSRRWFSQTMETLLAAPFAPAGYFSLNVPSGLTLYWFTNNLLTTAQQVRWEGGWMDLRAGGQGGLWLH